MRKTLSNTLISPTLPARGAANKAPWDEALKARAEQFLLGMRELNDYAEEVRGVDMGTYYGSIEKMATELTSIVRTLKAVDKSRLEEILVPADTSHMLRRMHHG